MDESDYNYSSTILMVDILTPQWDRECDLCLPDLNWNFVHSKFISYTIVDMCSFTVFYLTAKLYSEWLIVRSLCFHSDCTIWNRIDNGAQIPLQQRVGGQWLFCQSFEWMFHTWFDTKINRYLYDCDLRVLWKCSLYFNEANIFSISI